MPRFYRNACGRKVEAEAHFVGMGGYVSDGPPWNVIANEYQWLITRPDGYQYALDATDFFDIYKPADEEAVRYVQQLWIVSAADYLRKCGIERHGQPVALC